MEVQINAIRHEDPPFSNEIDISDPTLQRREDIESEQLGLLVRANNVLSGIQPLSMNVDNWPEQTEAQELVLKKLMAAVDDDGYYRVKIIEAEKTPPPDRSEGGAG